MGWEFFRNNPITDIFSGINTIRKEPWNTLWKTRFIQYLFIFDVVSIAGIIFFWYVDLIPTQSENAFYLVSSIIQIQAVIAALVITLTLIAIQMAAATYTSRVIDVMKKNPDMWYLLAIYVIAISYGLIVLKSIPSEQDQILVTSVLIFCIFTLVALFLYLKNTITLLHPDEIAKKLIGEINCDNVIFEKKSDDVLQPVFDVINESVRRFDPTTTRSSLSAVSEKIICVYPRPHDWTSWEISNHFCEHVKRSAIIALRNGDEGTLGEIFYTMGQFGSGSCIYENSDFLSPTISFLYDFSERTIENKMQEATVEASNALAEIGMKSADIGGNNLSNTNSDVVSALQRIATYSMQTHLFHSAEMAAIMIGWIGYHTADKGEEQYSQTTEVAAALEKIGKYAANIERNDIVEAVLRALFFIGFRDSSRELIISSLKNLQSWDKLELFQEVEKIKYEFELEEIPKIDDLMNLVREKVVLM